MMSGDYDYYTDEPLNEPDNGPEGGTGRLMQKSNWVSPPDEIQHGIPQSADKNLPPQLRELLKMKSSDEEHYVNRAISFRKQAVFMANYTDSSPIVGFSGYFPTYSSMNTAQLRSYFTIRNMLRHGEFPDVPLSYLFVYIYETLMQIGLRNPEEGYEILHELKNNYSGLNTASKRPYIDDWLKDYVVLYRLDGHFNEIFAKGKAFSEAAGIICNYSSSSDEDLFAAAEKISDYKISEKILYKKFPVESRSAVPFLLRRVFPHVERITQSSMKVAVSGHTETIVRRVFPGAVFWPDKELRIEGVNVCPDETWSCRFGTWKITAPVQMLSDRLHSEAISCILRDIDFTLRKKSGVKPHIRTPKLSSDLLSVLENAADEWKAEWNARLLMQKKENERIEREKARDAVKIDFSLLGKIRSDAEAVKEALVLDDETETEEHMDGITGTEHGETDKTDADAASFGRTDDEAEFLKLLLEHKDYRPFLRSRHIPEGVMVEKVNARMAELLGDVAIEEDENGRPSVIEDYRSDLEKYVYND